MLTQARARAIVLGSSGFFTTKGAHTNRKGVYAFDVNADLDTATLVIDYRALSPEEGSFLSKHFSTLTFEEATDCRSGDIVGFNNPYNTRPMRLPAHVSYGQVRSSRQKLFHLTSKYAWTIPAAFLDIRATAMDRARARDIYLEHGSPSNHERLILEAEVPI